MQPLRHAVLIATVFVALAVFNVGPVGDYWQSWKQQFGDKWHELHHQPTQPTTPTPSGSTP
ncbi:hypothetical protein [Glutamicibacter sp. V16R2B1]|uniref:hypothetical protein n=1 Tax=Glutamicibacter sp. V16R2B1 TaxID=2036207 RepID=UPI0010FD8892|nr:hypothetical protein [Glutamicibacter sp. V16R2B1]MCK9901314.1 hypothetical protein [Frankia sp. Cpl3]TLK46871.1 hypothetical protein FDN03_16110 [Glutamicibacter sp. V16R2B1]